MRLFSNTLREVPAEEQPDANAGKLLSDNFRKARRNLVIASAVSIGWSGAQFTVAEPKVEVAKISLQFDNASIPITLGLLLVYFLYRWAFEFAIMDREVRRWSPAQFDFRVVSVIARFAILAVSAGALQRSLTTVLVLFGLLALLALCVGLLIVVLTFLATPICAWVRERAGRPSVANAAFEAFAWASLLGIVIAVCVFLSGGALFYWHPSFRALLGHIPLNPVGYWVFVIVFVMVFLSHWLLRPKLCMLFAQRPSYRTYRAEDGSLVYEFGGGAETSHVQTAKATQAAAVMKTKGDCGQDP